MVFMMSLEGRREDVSCLSQGSAVTGKAEAVPGLHTAAVTGSIHDAGQVVDHRDRFVD
jgi:hypothetical protein